MLSKGFCNSVPGEGPDDLASILGVGFGFDRLMVVELEDVKASNSLATVLDLPSHPFDLRLIIHFEHARENIERVMESTKTTTELILVRKERLMNCIILMKSAIILFACFCSTLEQTVRDE